MTVIHFSKFSLTDFDWKLNTLNLDCLNFLEQAQSRSPCLKSDRHSLLKRESYWLWLKAEYRCTTVRGNNNKKQPWYGWTNTVRTKPTNKNKIDNKQTVRACNTANWFVCFVFLSITSLSFAGNLGRLTWVRHSSRKSSATHSYQRV